MIKKYFDIKLLAFAVLSAFIYALAITSFSIPAGLYPAGLSGLARITTDIFSNFLNTNIAYAIIYFSINVLLSMIVFKNIGKKFAIYSVVQFTFVSLFSSLLKPIIVLDNILLYAIFGGLINGFAVGLALSSNFSTGGSDFLSVYFSNKYKKSIWDYIFAGNVIIIAVAGILFGWDRALYSIIYQFCSIQIIKSMHKRYTYTTLTIITSKPKEVADEIQRNIRHGITEIHTHGHYSNTDNTMLYTVVNSFQYRNVISIVTNVDPHAFINVQKTAEIYGNYYQKPLD